MLSSTTSRPANVLAVAHLALNPFPAKALEIPVTPRLSNWPVRLRLNDLMTFEMAHEGLTRTATGRIDSMIGRAIVCTTVSRNVVHQLIPVGSRMLIGLLAT